MKITSKEREWLCRIKDTPIGVWNSVYFPMCCLAAKVGSYRDGFAKYKYEDVNPQRELVNSTIVNYPI